MSFDPLEPIAKSDQELIYQIENARAPAFEAGALGKKEKLLRVYGKFYKLHSSFSRHGACICSRRALIQFE